MNFQVKQPLIDLEAFERGSEPFVADPPSFDISALIRIVIARKNIIVATIAGVLVCAVIALVFITPTYSATSVMMLDQRKNAVEDVNAVLSGLPTDSASVQNQVQELTSRELATRVVDKLKLDLDPEFNSDPSGGLSILGWALPTQAASHLPLGSHQTTKGREAAVNRLLKRLSVDQIGMSTAMAISVASVDAAKSARLTNAVADVYLEDQLNAKFEATQKAAKWLSSRVQQVAAQVQTDEAAVQKYKAEHGIVDTAGGGSIIDQQTVSVSVQLINAKADLAQKVALFDRTNELQRTGRASEASQVVASPLIAQLRAQESELQRQEAQLASKYLPDHPKMVDIRSQKRDTRSKITAEVARVIDSLANDVAVGRANVQSLQASLDQLQSKFQTQNGASVKLKALESIAASSRSIYEGLLSRLKQIQGQEGIAAPDSRIITRAMVPSTANPKPVVVIGVAIPASLVLGLLFAFLAEGLDPSLRTTEHVDRYLGLPVLATVPEVGGQEANGGVAELVARDPSSSFAEAIRGLHLGLSLASADHAPKVVLVTSSVPGEGKTVIAISLARLAARHGRRVIIVDADFRRPKVAPTMGLSSPMGGIVDVLEGRLPLNQCVMRDGCSEADVLAGTDRPINPSDLLTTDSIGRLMITLRGQYDLVIVDSAPLLPVHDTLTLSQLSDVALFVAQSGKTPREAVIAALRSLKSMKVAVAGIALTRTKLDPRYYYRDYLQGVRSPAVAALPAGTGGKPKPAPVSGVRRKLRNLFIKSDEEAPTPRSGSA
ncbi:MAG: polysaccharide biosynthesis tyrosine autokinase [Micropepsaceae bacterium]